MAYDQETEQRIRERAYQIWIEEGQPSGRHEEHWRQAEAELLAPSPPLQPLEDNGQDQVPAEAPAAGINPDDVTR